MHLNSAFLRNRVTELGLKQWWLAEQVGVDRKTVIRWLQGQVRTIQPENAEALARVLQCQAADFCHEDAAESLATPEDQKTAAQLLASSSLIEHLGPIGEWKVVESLLKATIVQELPLHVLGELYNQLTVACWRQSKIEQAELYNRKALELADRAGDRKIRAEALLSQANLYSWRGNSKEAEATYEECLRLRLFLSPKTVGAVHSNLGAVLYEAGNLEAGLKQLELAKECFLLHGKPMNFSILFCHEAMIFLQAKKLALAKAACSRSLAFARKADYRRGLQMCRLIQAELLARQGEGEAALRESAQALEGFAALGIQEGLNYEFAGRVQRILKNFAEAERLLQTGIEIARSFPIYQAALYFELAKTRAAAGMPAGEAAAKAIDLYKNCGCPLRLEQVEKAFPIKG